MSVWPGPVRNLLLSLAILIFLWPILRMPDGVQPGYPILTILLLMAFAAVVALWGQGVESRRRWAMPGEGGSPLDNRQSHTRTRAAQFVAAAASLAIVNYAVQHWVSLMLWNPFRTDMLVVIREAISRFLEGRTPYATYRAYDAPWDMVMPYGPILWGPFMIPQMAGVDLRVVTILGALFVPVCSAWAAVVEAGRDRWLSSASWLVLITAIVASIDLTAFTTLGHTPAYWPLIPPFAILVTKERWTTAGIMLGVLIVARTTMVALVPCLLMTVWIRRRSQLATSVIGLAATAALLLLPFAIWDPAAMWYDMVASYPRLMKVFVWPSLDRGVMKTFGLTGWLLSHQQGRLVEISQVLALIVTYAISWRALRRGAAPLPWMALALLVFSMTSLWPVYYIYFDVILLFAAAAFAETLAPDHHPGVASWMAAVAVIVVVVLISLRTQAAPFPSIEMSSAESEYALLEGFDRNRADGDKEVAPVSGPRATFCLPRASRSAAVLVVDARTPEGVPQRVTAVLNGKLLGTAESDDQWRTLRFPAPAAAWWIGFNRLELVFSDDHPTLGINRVGVQAK